MWLGRCLSDWRHVIFWGDFGVAIFYKRVIKGKCGGSLMFFPQHELAMVRDIREIEGLHFVSSKKIAKF